MGERGGQLAIYLISKISKGSNGSEVRWKAIPQMCPAVAETTFQNESVRGLGRANLLSLFLNP